MRHQCIVAEISANHLGSLDRAMALIESAAKAGADCVKFQLYDPERMAPAGKVIQSGPWAGRDMRDLYREAMTPKAWFPALFFKARELGIEPFTSVFHADDLPFLESLDCPRYKIASFELVDRPLLRAVAKTGKPMIVSTGMATRPEIFDAIATILTANARCDLTVLKCTSGYPAPVSEANLLAMDELIRCGVRKVGLSDHTMNPAVPIAATALGASLIEAHLTLDRGEGGPDAGFSYEPHEFTAMVKGCRDAAAALGEVRFGPTASEEPQLAIRGRTLAA